MAQLQLVVLLIALVKSLARLAGVPGLMKWLAQLAVQAGSVESRQVWAVVLDSARLPSSFPRLVAMVPVEASPARVQQVDAMVLVGKPVPKPWQRLAPCGSAALDPWQGPS